MTAFDQQLPLAFEAVARDAALDLLERYRSDLVGTARAIALRIERETGRVTSVEVLAEMRRLGHGQALDAHDRRFMGAVFRQGEGWKRIGWEPTGSHCRPVAIWRRA